MPFSVKSARIVNDVSADMRSHMIKIWTTTTPKDSMFYTDSTGTFVKLDSSDMVYGNTLDLVCLRCHPGWTIQYVYPIAENIHEEGLGVIPNQKDAYINGFAVLHNYPNPFNVGTTIEFSIPQADFVSLTIVDLNGRIVDKLMEERLTAGKYDVNFNAAHLASGLYVCRLATSTASLFHKMLLIK